jgi:hypothetical protein
LRYLYNRLQPLPASGGTRPPLRFARGKAALLSRSKRSRTAPRALNIYINYKMIFISYCGVQPLRHLSGLLRYFYNRLQPLPASGGTRPPLPAGRQVSILSRTGIIYHIYSIFTNQLIFVIINAIPIYEYIRIFEYSRIRILRKFVTVYQ